MKILKVLKVGSGILVCVYAVVTIFICAWHGLGEAARYAATCFEAGQSINEVIDNATKYAVRRNRYNWNYVKNYLKS